MRMLSVDLGPARFSQHKTEDGWLRAVCALALNGWNMIATSVHEEVGAWCGRSSESLGYVIGASQSLALGFYLFVTPV